MWVKLARDGVVQRFGRSTRQRWSMVAIRSALLALLILSAGHGQSQEKPGRIVFGGDAAFPPFEWLDQGASRGFNVELIKNLAQLGNADLEFRLSTWPDTLAALERREVDVVTLFPSAERSKDFLFTAPFHYVNHATYAAAGVHSVDSVEDLGGQRVAIAQRSFVAHQLQQENIDLLPVVADSVVNALLALIHGEAEYAILPIPTADRLIHHLNMPVRKVVPAVWPAAYSFAVRRDRPELFTWLQHNLDRAAKTGRLRGIHERWRDEMEFHPPRDPHQVALFVLGLMASLITAVVLILAWSWRLRQRVNVRTEELHRSEAQARAAESKARHFADYDSSTDLPREHEFIRQVDDMLNNKSNGKPQELRLIKLTELNEVITMLGREYGEQLIRRFADSIRHFAQGSPCGYLGRGVYALCHEAQAMPRLFETLLSHWSSKDEKVYSQIVGGSAFWPEHGQSGADLVQCAETALSASRSSGKRWMAYSPDMEPEADELEMVSRFRANELEGLAAVYQPQIDLRSGSVAAAEALVRWNHPTLGKVAPSRFIPLIEKAGLVSQVTSLMLNKAAQLSASLRRDGLPSMISVNITISDLMENDLPSEVEQTLKRHGALASDLKLELTETSVASDLKSVTDMLHKLHDGGISLSVDDFGTGYSSLSYLSAFPIHEVKIDRHFVFDMVRNSRNRSIVRSTILMARELGLQTVAEGAEDRATLEMLAEYNCDRVQGYVFSPPLEEAGFREYVRKYQTGGLL